MKEKTSIEKIQSHVDTFNENIKKLDLQNITDEWNEIKEFITDTVDEKSYRNNYLMIRLKNETAIGFQAMEKHMEMNLVLYDEKHFDFRCELRVTIGSFFAYIKFKKSNLIPEHVTHKKNLIASITIENGGKITPPREWNTIVEILDNLNLTKKSKTPPQSA